AGEAGDAVVLVDDDVAGAQVGERAQRAAPAAAGPLVVALGAATAEEAVLGDDGELEARRDEALAQAGDGEAQLGCGHPRAVGPLRAHAGEVVGDALAVAAVRP